MGVKVAPAVGTPEGRLAGMQALALIERLLLLDELWTRLMDDAASGDDRSALDRPDVMRDLGRDIDAALGEVADRAYEVRLMLDSLTDEQFDRALDAVAATPGAPPELRSTLTDALPDYEPRGAAITACDYIVATHAEESALLYQKLDALERGEALGGDLRFPFRCAGFLAVVGAGVAATVITGGAAAVVGLQLASAVGGGVYGWSGAGCPRVLPEISFGRR